MRVCSPEKTPADGIYILHDTIQNGHIVYKQLENVGTGKLPNLNRLTNYNLVVYILIIK